MEMGGRKFDQGILTMVSLQTLGIQKRGILKPVKKELRSQTGS